MFRRDAQRKAMFANMNDGPSGSTGPKQDTSNYRPPTMHKSSEPENTRNVNVPGDFRYPDKPVKPSYATRANISRDVTEITRKDDSIHNAPDNFDDYKESINDEMNSHFSHDYNRVVKKAERQYKKES